MAIAHGTIPAFEYEGCSRCSGSGRHSFNEITRDVCFKCNGSGYSLTKRGAAAQEFYRAKCRIALQDVQPGMRVEVAGWICTVAKSEAGPSMGQRLRDGVLVDMPSWHLTSVKGTGRGFDTAFVATLKPQGEDRAKRIADALAYQATLTKAGKPRANSKLSEVIE